jgi:LPXTG-motif cell wall-anchored protein
METPVPVIEDAIAEAAPPAAFVEPIVAEPVAEIAEPVAPPPALAELPQTGTSIPTVAVFGTSALLAGLGNGTFRRRWR